MEDEYELEEIKQTRGPMLKFEGKLLCEDQGGPVHMEVWQTRGGALIAVTSAEMHRGPSGLDVRATVVEPGEMADALTEPAWEREQQRMRLAVMEAFNWDNRARSMVRKQLKWQLVQEVA